MMYTHTWEGEGVYNTFVDSFVHFEREKKVDFLRSTAAAVHFMMDGGKRITTVQNLEVS
jgi:hypothetical protein